MEEVRKNTNYLFAEFRNKEEYQEAYKSVMDRLPKKHQFEFVMFAERLRTTMLCSIEPITKTSLKKG
jgi:hypothetical protein